MIEPLLELRPEVVAFAQLMERGLRNNDHKGSWKNDAPMALFSRMLEETIELKEALILLAGHESIKGVIAHVAAEAADVANFAMMVADVVGAIPVLIPADAIVRNQVLIARHAPGEDHTLERADDLDGKLDSIGPAVVFPAYKPPRDPRVKEILAEAAKTRAADAPPPVPRKTFSDPRLDPNYKPPRRPNTPR